MLREEVSSSSKGTYTHTISYTGPCCKTSVGSLVLNTTRSGKEWTETATCEIRKLFYG